MVLVIVSYDKDNVWLSFDALKAPRRVTEVVCWNRYSITLFTPGKLDRLTPSSWGTLARFGFPIYMYDVTSLQTRRLPEDSPTKPMNPKTLLDCCQCAKEFTHEYDLADGDDTGINIMRPLNHWSRILEQLGEMTDAAKDKNREAYLLGLLNLLHVVCNMTQEAGLEPALSAAFSLKHVTDRKKSIITQEETMDKAKELGLSPEANSQLKVHLACEGQVCQAT